MSKKKEIIQELESLSADRLIEVHGTLKSDVDQNYLYNAKEEILAQIAIPIVEESVPNKTYLSASKREILSKVNERSSKIRSINSWRKPIALAASLLLLISVGITLMGDEGSETVNMSNIETDQIIDFLYEELGELDTDELYTALDAPIEMEETDYLDGVTLDMLYDEVSLETIEDYF